MTVETANHGDAGDSIFQKIHDRDVRPWLDLVDELRAHGISQDLPLPQIAVMGDQSCGKSSVLEAISGIPFPRGSGLVTRCATQLTMKSGPKGSGWMASAFILQQHKSRERKSGAKHSSASLTATTPEALTKIIEDLQDVLTEGDSRAFSTEAISVQVQAPGLPDLTLIDLPGIVRTTTKGQRSSVMLEVNALIQRYLEQERTIILAVVPANQDVATVDILERAKTVDPDGDRTIGVLTKPDLIGPGNEDEAAAVLKNIRKPLKLGYVMVKCRSQRDIDQGMDNKDALSAETAFFRSQPVFKALPSSFFGIPHLTKRLSELLVGRIKAALPSIKWEIQSQLVQTDARLKPMVKGVPQTTAECHACLMNIVSDYCRLLRQSARGYYRDDVLSAKPSLRLHAASQSIFRRLHDNIAATVPGFNDMGFGDRLGREIAALRGREMPGFLNHQVFYGFMIQNVETWRQPVESCRTQAANAALAVASLLVETLAVQFPRLCAAVRDVLAAQVEELADEVSVRIEEIFQKESDPFTTNEGMLDVINTIRFRHFDKAVEDAMDEAGETPENMETLKTTVVTHLGKWYMLNHGVGTMANVEDMCTLLQAYWNVATKRLVDNVCMTMEQDFVVKLLSKVESELFLLTNRYSDVEELFLEDTSVIEKRRTLQAKKQRLLNGLETLMRMAPDVIAQRPGGSDEDSSTVEGSDMLADLRKGSGTYSNTRDDPAEMTAHSVKSSLIAQAEERSVSTDWSRTAWSRPAPSYSSSSSTAEQPSRFIGNRRQPSSGVSNNSRYISGQPDHYDLPVRPNQSVGGESTSGASIRGRNGYGDARGGRGGDGEAAANSAQQEQEILVGRLVDMGFSRPQAEEALIMSGGDPDQAAVRLMMPGSDGGDATNDTRGRAGASAGRSRTPPHPVRGLPDNFSEQANHPVTASGTRSTHFFGRGTAADQSRDGRSSPVVSSGSNVHGGQHVDDSLSGFLASSGSQQQSSRSRSGGTGGNAGDRYGLFTAASEARGATNTIGEPRVARSRARYGTLFGDEEKGESNNGVRQRTNTSALFGDDG